MKYFFNDMACKLLCIAVETISENLFLLYGFGANINIALSSYMDYYSLGFGLGGLGRLSYKISETIGIQAGLDMAYNLIDLDIVNLIDSYFYSPISHSFQMQPVISMSFYGKSKEKLNSETMNSQANGETTSMANNENFTGSLKNGKPEGQGTLNSGGYTTTGNFINGNPEGFVIIKDPQGRQISGIFQNGKANGTFNGESESGIFQSQFENGIRVDKEVNRLTINLNKKIDKLKNQAQTILTSGNPISATEDLLFEIAEKRQQMQENHRAEEIMAQFSYGEKDYTISSGEGGSLKISAMQKDIIYDSEGNVVEINKITQSNLLNEKGIGFEVKEETITRVSDPVKKVSLVVGNIGGNLMFTEFVSTFGANGGISIRSFSSSGEYFPGTTGGKGKGLDLRAGVDFMASSTTVDFSSLGLEKTSSFTGVINLQGTVGYTWFKFKELNKETLEQKGSGFTMGLGAKYSIALTSDETVKDAMGGLSFAPLASFDFYNFNPNTAKYSSKTISGSIWPFPLSLVINYGFSF